MQAAHPNLEPLHGVRMRIAALALRQHRVEPAAILAFKTLAPRRVIPELLGGYVRLALSGCLDTSHSVAAGASGIGIPIIVGFCSIGRRAETALPPHWLLWGRGTGGKGALSWPRQRSSVGGGWLRWRFDPAIPRQRGRPRTHRLQGGAPSQPGHSWPGFMAEVSGASRALRLCPAAKLLDPLEGDPLLMARARLRAGIGGGGSLWPIRRGSVGLSGGTDPFHEQSRRQGVHQLPFRQKCSKGLMGSESGTHVPKP
mmetsp:Transcript_7909/g.18951  ORF Transcript_7909/g.18951 Transcript_7909/m.18951 type:complete len:256 (-) Transcript_7909:66-833(-)